jgi:hypothetical protein
MSILTGQQQKAPSYSNRGGLREAESQQFPTTSSARSDHLELELQ